MNTKNDNNIDNNIKLQTTKSKKNTNTFINWKYYTK